MAAYPATGDRWSDDDIYRARITLIADLIHSRISAYQRGGKWPPKVRGILTRDDIVEYRAHIVMERLGGTLTEEQATKAIGMADQAEALILLHRAATGGTHA